MQPFTSCFDRPVQAATLSVISTNLYLIMLYFNSQKIPELSGLNFAQRMELMRNAKERLTTPVKMWLNIVKLLIITPLFLLIARSSGWEIVAYALLLIILYPLITRPLTYFVCRKQFPRLRQEMFPE